MPDFGRVFLMLKYTDITQNCKFLFQKKWFKTYSRLMIYIYIYIYRVSQEECSRLRETVS